jgi:hypothetical protein
MLGAFVLATACRAATPTPSPVAQSRVEMSAAAREYLAAALDTLQRVTLRADTVPWNRIRDSAFAIAAGAQRPFDTYSAIDWAMRHANKHSFLQVAVPGAVSQMVRGRLGYIHVPQRGGAGIPLADSLHTAIRALQDSGACGWIVDLRANGGGNMWPMLAGIGPLLGDSLVGNFIVQGSVERWFYRRGTSGTISAAGKTDTVSRVTVPVVELRDPSAAIAVLFDRGTASSGEAVAVAFLGRPATRTFGTRSAGFATVNRGARLADGANMVVTTGYYADRRGTVHMDQLTPDSTLGISSAWPSPTDRIATAAADWLEHERSCRPGQ